jgi:hypothetical protein
MAWKFLMPFRRANRIKLWSGWGLALREMWQAGQGRGGRGVRGGRGRYRVKSVSRWWKKGRK